LFWEPWSLVRIDFQIPPTAPPGPDLILPWLKLVAGNSITGFQSYIGATIAVK